MKTNFIGFLLKGKKVKKQENKTFFHVEKKKVTKIE